MNRLFVHSVYFWLNPDHTIGDKIEFEKGVNTLLSTPGLRFGQIGIAAGTRREIIDFSYDYHLLLIFNSEADHEAYQTTDKTHQKFIADCRQYWHKIQIYDSIGL